MAGSIHRVFGQMATQYQQFRPNYPEALVAELMKRVSQKNLFLDVACGTGQLTRQLAPHFQASMGVDKAHGSVNEASKHSDGIRWLEGDALHLPADSNSVSLLTVAQGLHWFLDDPPRLWAEFHRVLEPQGVLAVTSYAVIQPNDAHLKLKFDNFYLEKLGSHYGPSDPRCAWKCDRRWVDSGYEGVVFPYPETASKQAFRVPVTLSREHFFGYIRTMSALSAFKDEDPVRQLEEDFGDVEAIEGHITFWLLTFVKK